MIPWSDFRAQIRRSILKSTGQTPWTDEVLRDLAWWALDTFTAHTAAATSVQYAPTGTTYALPANKFESVNDAGLVSLIDSVGTATQLPPFSLREQSRSGPTYEEWPQGTLKLSETPTGATYLEVRYFAYWSHPYADSDPITIPTWAVHAVGHLVGAYAMTSVMTNAGNIDQWNDKTDSGNPTDNPLKELQRELLRVYENEIGRFSRQDRHNFWSRYQT